MNKMDSKNFLYSPNFLFKKNVFKKQKSPVVEFIYQLTLIGKPLQVKRSGVSAPKLHYIFALIIFNCFCSYSHAQCPPNIDFETGTFDGWTCYAGYTAAAGNTNQINLFPSSPMPGRHTMMDRTANVVLDPYGNFPVNAPNGSGRSIRLGNDQGGAEAEGVSYEFTIPANRNTFSLIYYYAVVFQDPNHEQYQQPRMVVEITNITDNTVIDCSSVRFIPYGTVLPGFFISQIAGDDGTPIWCKDWSAVTINLNNMAGKTIKLFFKTADCTFRRHFGYAYVDVNTECSDEFVGASYCRDDTAVNVVGPYGYQGYTWFNSSFSQSLGSAQTLTISPPPPVGTLIALEVVPYAGYGCTDTLYARLMDTLTAFANAGPDILSCNETAVQLGAPPRPGFVYSWLPATGLDNATISNPFAIPSATTSYELIMRSRGGGCLTRDTVLVTASIIDGDIRLVGKSTFCLDNNDSAVLYVTPSSITQWYRDGVSIPGATQTRYRANQSGSYHAVIKNVDGCQLTTSGQTVLIDKARPGVTYPEEYAVSNLPLPLQARDFGANYLWSPGISLNSGDVMNPVFTGRTEQRYLIRIATATECITIDTQVVKIIPAVEIYVPTAFTPNGDGKNDILSPTLMGLRDLYYFRVFNRWGELLYETKTKRAGWDGKLRGLPQASGVFVWVVAGMGVDGKTHTRRGTSALIR